MEAYHDTEWGVPEHDDRRHFEFLILEGAQAGLSWRTVLRRREGYRRAFAGFDPAKVARFTPARIEKLLADPGIIRNRLKVNAAVGNARAFLAVRKEFGTFDAFIWRFVGGSPLVNARKTVADIPALTVESEALSTGARQAGVPLRRTDDRLRAHAGVRPGQRPSGGCPRWADLGGGPGRARRARAGRTA